jgi:hypothetical protein
VSGRRGRARSALVPATALAVAAVLGAVNGAPGPRAQPAPAETSAVNPQLGKLSDNAWARLMPNPSRRSIPRNFTASGTLEDQPLPPSRTYGGIHYGNGQLFMWGGGHRGYPGNDVEVYDIARNVWVQQYPPEVCTLGDPACTAMYNGSGILALTPAKRPWAEHTYQYFAYDPSGRRFIGLLTPGTWAYDTASRQWTALAGPFAGGTFSPRGYASAHHLFGYDPQVGGFPAVVAAGPGVADPTAYLFAHGTWTRRGPARAGESVAIYSVYVPDRRAHLVRWGAWWGWYDAVADRWTPTRAPAVSVDSFDYDTLNRVVIGVQHQEQAFSVHRFDPATDAWSPIAAEGPVPGGPIAGASLGAPSLRYDPQHNAFLFLKQYGGGAGSGGTTELWAYRYRRAR